ncbi:MAG: LamG-like jellyroll fold domain-containing protein [Planctomycetota bacterium]|jgi:tetratricopeptide (TPR) repeat protein
MAWKDNKLVVAIVLLLVLLAAGSAHAGLVAHWKLDEIGGTTVSDSSGNGYDGTAVEGLPNWNSEGRFEGCLEFNEFYGVEIPPDVFKDIDSSITVSVWLKGDARQKGKTVAVLNVAANNTKDYTMRIFTDKRTDCNVVFETRNDDIEFSIDSGKWNGRWNHLAFVKDAAAGIQKAYLDGKVVAEKTDAFMLMGPIRFARIGIATDRAGDQFCGKMDDMRIYSRALSQNEIDLLCHPDPTLQMMAETVQQGQAAIAQKNFGKAAALIEKRIAEAEKAARKNSINNIAYYKELYFDLGFLLARAKEGANLPRKDFEAAYKRALEQGTPSSSNCASVLLWLLDHGSKQEREGIVDFLNKNNEDYLRQVSASAREMVRDGQSKAAARFLDDNLAVFSQWRAKHPDADVISAQMFPDAYFWLAKAREGAGASKKDIADAYSGTFAPSRFNLSGPPEAQSGTERRFSYISHQVAALMWLVNNECIEELTAAVRPFTQKRGVAEPWASAVRSICRDLESKKDWDGSERFLDALFGEAQYPFEWSVFVESCLANKTNRWARKYSEYLNGNPQFLRGRDRNLADKYVAEGKSEQAVKVYQAILDRCEPAEKREIEFELCNCMFSAGRYREVIPKLEAYITTYRETDQSRLEEIMLLKARAFMHLGELDKAIDSCSALIAAFPRTKQVAAARFLMGYCHMLRGAREKAAETLGLVTQEYPGSSYASKAKLCLARLKSVAE